MLEENPPSPIRGTPQPTPQLSHPHLNPNTIDRPPHDPTDMLSEDAGVVYGTAIDVRSSIERLKSFVLEFEETKRVGEETVTEHLYRNRLSEMESEEGYVFEVDGQHLREYDLELYLNLVYSPAEMISCFDQVVKDLFQKYFMEAETNAYTQSVKALKKEQLMVGLTHLSQEELVCLKGLTPKHIGRLVCVRGLVIRESQVFPQMKTAHFICTHCDHTVNVQLQNARVKQPERCPSCRRVKTFELMSNYCQFTDKQYIKVQELPQLVSDGETPQACNIIAYDCNVDRFRPGDRVEVIGIYRASPSKVEKSTGSLRTVFNTYIDLISTNSLEQKKTRIDNTLTFTDDDMRSILKMADRRDEEGRSMVITDLVNSFAPSIYGHSQVKKGILAQLFGGTKKEFGTVGRSQFRSDINVLLLGDPSTAKSQLLQHVVSIAPRCIYTNGRGASAVGLTAHVRKDPQTREFVLESGALVMSDQGICCIDEFDKMEDNSRVVLLQAMEQQTLSIAKAGIVCQLNSRTAILAAANPKESKYQVKKSVVENINLPPNLLSRFDLLYILLDVPNQDNDTSIAAHIIELYMSPQPEGDSLEQSAGDMVPEPTIFESRKEEKKKVVVYDTEELIKYISFARQHVHPTISKEAGARIVREYTDMRSFGRSKNTISATPRQLESMIRISEAFARMRLSRQVQEIDVAEASDLIRAATLASSIDPETGVVDMGILTTGNSSASKNRREQLSGNIQAYILANTSKFRAFTSVRRFYEEAKTLISYNAPAGEEDRWEDWSEAIRVLQTRDIIVTVYSSKHSLMFKLSHDFAEHNYFE